MNNNDLKISQNNFRLIIFHKICRIMNSEEIGILSINETYLTSKVTQYDVVHNLNIVRCDQQHTINHVL